ncbi:hypothetical protein OO17_22945 [Rhodopseudomonas palustris]|uniref:Uncharacterized protein n=1 Tax=Rhodopseudomonas palustris TaxID=1076 RepID=A0A0D7ECD8_RHOPL|nr:hypothetical protein OO17_22945 [Rhodopseudomonas palustris]
MFHAAAEFSLPLAGRVGRAAPAMRSSVGEAEAGVGVPQAPRPWQARPDFAALRRATLPTRGREKCSGHKLSDFVS